MGLFDGLDQASAQNKKSVVLRAPFGYPGGKSRSLDNILPHLPYRERYVEPFGGSASVLLSRGKSKLEVYNDAYSGVVCFYECLRDPVKFDALITRLDLSVHAREEFITCRDTWEGLADPVERAARWYTMIESSFGSLGRNWGRQMSKSSMAGKIRRKLKLFPKIHERFESVQVENQDWERCLRDYDSKQTVFYLDPPYVDVHRGTYKNEMSIERHRDLIQVVTELDGFVAISGYANDLYDAPDWDARYTWEAFVSIQSTVPSAGNGKKTHDTRGHATEVLWIKEAKV